MGSSAGDTRARVWRPAQQADRRPLDISVAFLFPHGLWPLLWAGLVGDIERCAGPVAGSPTPAYARPPRLATRGGLITQQEHQMTSAHLSYLCFQFAGIASAVLLAVAALISRKQVRHD